MKIETARLVLREFEVQDAVFILELLNEPGFLRYIGDKGVRSLADARSYLEQGPIESYRRNGFGLYAACARGNLGEPLGMCGLVKRATLPDPDLGFAFLQRHWGRGYALESAAAVLDHGRHAIKLRRISAITSPENWASIRVLEKVGLKFQQLTCLTGSEDQVKLFS